MRRVVVSVHRHGRVVLPVQVHVGLVRAEAGICARCGNVLDPRSMQAAPTVGEPAWELVCPRCVSDVDRATLEAIEASVDFAAYVPEVPADIAVIVPDRNPLGEA